jgi:hypothetical protein
MITDLQLLLVCILCTVLLLTFYHYRLIQKLKTKNPSAVQIDKKLELQDKTKHLSTIIIDRNFQPQQKSENLPAVIFGRKPQPEFKLHRKIELLESSLDDKNDDDSWCLINYFEMNSTVGRTFEGKNKTIIVDGFFNPGNDTDRFSLGQLTNVNRSLEVEKVRRYIGKGVELSFINGELHIECLSENAIFVLSKSLNCASYWPADTVNELPNKCCMSVFNEAAFFQQINRAAKEGYEAVQKLTEMCFIRLSFVKGWGAEYDPQEVTLMPCWIEITLLEPLEMIDKVLSRMTPPLDYCSSD